MKKLKQLCIRYREYILYIVFGLLTTLISWATFRICVYTLGMGSVPGNIISWVLSVAFAYITNRIWVFESRSAGAAAVLREVWSFVASRLFTLVLETGFIWLTVDKLGAEPMLMKVVGTVVTVILNYFLSKLIVFRHNKNN